MFGRIKDRIHSVAPELQFWGYEGGNVLEAIAGAGGFAAFYDGLISVSTMPTQSVSTRVAAAFTGYPDILVTAGLAIIVLATILFGSDERPRAKLWIDRIASLAGLVLVGTALYFGASWITFAAVSFVCASALLRLCRVSPVFLKLGGLMLAAGGLGLAGFGISVIHAQPVLLASLTVLTGIYVVFASLMTYQGGIFECSGSSSPPQGARRSLFDPNSAIARLLETWIDRPVVLLLSTIALPAVFWVSAETKAKAPFLTSMWTRLPWRLLTAGAALATGTSAGLIFGLANAFWAVGDVAIGSLDWKTSAAEENPGALSEDPSRAGN